MAENGTTENTVRDLLRTALREGLTLEYLKGLIEEVKAASVRLRAFCPDCRAVVYPETPDYAKQVRMLAELVDQAEGRPGTDAGETGGVTLIIERPWFGLEPEEAERLTLEEQEIVERAHAIITRLGIPVRARPA
jgi:hypothetical protein